MLQELAAPSEALARRIMLLFGSGRTQGILVRVYEDGRCVRAVGNMGGVWLVEGSDVQPREEALVEAGMPEDLYEPRREDYDATAMHEYDEPEDRQVIESSALAAGAVLPRASDYHLKLMGFDEHVWGTREPVAVRERKRRWWSRLLGG